MAAPLVAGGARAGMLTFGDFSGADRLLCLVAAVGGFSGGGILGIMSRTRYTKAVVAGSEQFATWRAAWPDRRRRPLQVLGAAAIAVALLGFVVSFVWLVWHVRWLQTLMEFLVPVGAVVVHRRAPWRLPVICDRQEIDDEKAVSTALGRHLPRLPAA